MASPRGWGLLARVSFAVAVALVSPPFTAALRGEGAGAAAERLQPWRTLVKTLVLAKSHLLDPRLVDWPSHVKAPPARAGEAPSNTLGLHRSRDGSKARGRPLLGRRSNAHAFTLLTEGACFNLFEGPSAFVNGKQALVKRISLQREEDVGVLKREIEISNAFSGRQGFVLVYGATEPEHIVAHKDAFIEMEKPIATVRELSETGMYRNVGLHVKLRLFAQVAHAVKTMSDAGVMHRALASGNVLILGDEGNPETWRAVVSDFHAACTRPDGKWPSFDHEISGALEFKAPESYTPGYADPQGDIYSLGIIVFHMLFGRLPHSWYQSPEDLRKAGRFDVNNDPRLLSLEGNMLVLSGLLRSMLERSPSDRPTIEEVCLGIKDYAEWQHLTLESDAFQ